MRVLLCAWRRAVPWHAYHGTLNAAAGGSSDLTREPPVVASAGRRSASARTASSAVLRLPSWPPPGPRSGWVADVMGREGIGIGGRRGGRRKVILWYPLIGPTSSIPESKRTGDVWIGALPRRCLHWLPPTVLAGERRWWPRARRRVARPCATVGRGAARCGNAHSESSPIVRPGMASQGSVGSPPHLPGGSVASGCCLMRSPGRTPRRLYATHRHGRAPTSGLRSSLALRASGSRSST